MSLRLVKSAARAALRANEIVAGWALRPVLFREWKRPYLVGINERPLEYRFAFDAILRCAPKDLLDVGPGQSAFPSLVAESGVLVTALDKVDEYWTGAFVNRHYHVVRDDITRPKLGRQFDMVTCLSVLEHIPEHEAAMRGMFSLLRPGGHVVLTIPYADRA